MVSNSSHEQLNEKSEKIARPRGVIPNGARVGKNREPISIPETLFNKLIWKK